MVKVYGDESMDEADRVFTLAALIGEEGEWGRLANRWQARCLEDGIKCYHASDCAGQWSDFKHLSKERCVSLNADLTTYMTETKLWGFAVSVSNKDYLDVSQSSAEAKVVLGSSQYFLAMQLLVFRICEDFLINNPNYPMAFLFEENKGVSGQAKQIWDEVRKKNLDLSDCMGSISYVPKRLLVPLQVADEFAFESMKNALAYLDGRVDRKPIARLKEGKIIKRLDWLDKKGLEGIVAQQRHLV